MEYAQKKEFFELALVDIKLPQKKIEFFTIIPNGKDYKL